MFSTSATTDYFDSLSESSSAEPQSEAQSIDSVSTESSNDDMREKKKFVVIGGGWGGWGAAKALCEAQLSDAEVILLDALPDPTGTTPYLSASGKPVEAGTRGFWKDYPNINQLCAELGVEEEDVFTDFTNSSFYSPNGLEATAPVFSKAETLPPFLAQLLSPQKDKPGRQLPSPLGQILATFPLFERLPLEDRASMVGLLAATVDCLGSEEESEVRRAYDRMTAHELFLKFKLSKRLVDDFLRPTLLVGLFKPPEELSALVVMELLYYYALAHQDSFDVRWIRRGTVADSLLAPLATYLEDTHHLRVCGGCRVEQISTVADADTTSSKQCRAHSITYFDTKSQQRVTLENVEGIVLALGCKGMQSVISRSPDLARFPQFSQAASLQGIDVISVRLWFDRAVQTRTPANVFANFESLRGAGGTFFMLDQLQADAYEELWGNDGKDAESRGSVVACDFYNAGALLSLTDEDIVTILTRDLLPSAVPAFADAQVLDSWVGRYQGTVSWFSPGSYVKRPPLEGAGRSVLPNVKVAGDWVRLGKEFEQSVAKGLCQERAYVSGLRAANALVESCPDQTSKQPHDVLPLRPDEAPFQAAVALNRALNIPRFWIR